MKSRIATAMSVAMPTPPTWLTGSKAHAVIAALAEQGTYAGLSKPQMLALARLAQSVASTRDAGHALALIRSSEG